MAIAGHSISGPRPVCSDSCFSDCQLPHSVRPLFYTQESCQRGMHFCMPSMQTNMLIVRRNIVYNGGMARECCAGLFDNGDGLDHGQYVVVDA